MLYYRDAANVNRCAECGDEINLREHFGPDACLTGCPSCWQRSIDPNAPAPERDVTRTGDTVRVQIAPGYAHTYAVHGWLDDNDRPILDVDLESVIPAWLTDPTVCPCGNRATVVYDTGTRTCADWPACGIAAF
jgi:hypothetical protein